MSAFPPRLAARCLALVLGCATIGVAGETKINGRTFNLPEGFAIELIAGPPLVDRPIVADFDDEGRLYVADSSGSNGLNELSNVPSSTAARTSCGWLTVNTWAA